MDRVLVTGAGGAVGTALLKRLETAEYEVIGLDREPNEWSVESRFVRVDLCSGDTLPDADVIVHLAAHSQVQPMVADPALAVENVRTTERVLRHARDCGADVLLASSREVYGSAIRPDEDAVSVEATNPYGASKIASESIASAYAACFGVDVITLRFSNIYGPYDRNARVVPTFIALGSAGRELTVYGDETVLDFVYVEDVISAIERAIERRRTISGEAVTIGSGRGTRLSELAERIVELVDDCPGYTVEPNRTGDTERFVAKTEKADALLEFEPTPLAVGLPETVAWYLDHDCAVTAVRKKLGD